MEEIVGTSGAEIFIPPHRGLLTPRKSGGRQSKSEETDSAMRRKPRLLAAWTCNAGAFPLRNNLAMNAFRTLGALCLIGSCTFVQAQTPGADQTQPPAGNRPDSVILLVPVDVTDTVLQSGCWAQLYEERNFKGDASTVLGPIEIQALDKGTARRLHRAIDSLVVGPKATLTVYEHKAFKDKSMDFSPNTREPAVAHKLGITGRIESMRLTCSS